MIFLIKFRRIFLICIFFLVATNLFGQVKPKTYDELVIYIESDKLNNKEKIDTINYYIKQADSKKNNIDKFRLLELKSYYSENKEALIIADKLIHLAYELKNDSLIEISFTNKSSALYLQRNFREALKYSLKALNINKLTKNKFELYGTLIDIGNIYYHTQDYAKAEKYFNEALEYFKHDKNFIGKQGHLLLLYNLGKVYWRISNIHELTKTIDEFENYISSKTSKTDLAYLNYLKSGKLYLQNKNGQSISYLKQSINIIKDNKDYTNEHVGYLFLGKNLWKLNKKEQAVKEFSKVDELFNKHNFLNYELREAYEYLIQYYKENNDIKNQLFYTEKLILLNNQFEFEQRNITKVLHNDYENKKLVDSKNDLKEKLLITKMYLTISIILFIIVGFFIFKKIKSLKTERENWKLKFNKIISTLEIDNNSINDKTIELKSEITIKDNNDINIELTNSEIKISKYLKIFEMEKKFLTPIKIEDIVDELNIGRTTLSQYFNNYKDGFNNYINNLRINEVLIDLKNDENLRELSIENIAQKYGYNNSKTFFNQFKRITGIPPTFYIKQLNLEEKSYLS